MLNYLFSPSVVFVVFIGGSLVGEARRKGKAARQSQRGHEAERLIRGPIRRGARYCNSWGLINCTRGVSRGELELELIQTQMAQKPMLRAEVGMRVRCANKASAE